MKYDAIIDTIILDDIVEAWSHDSQGISEIQYRDIIKYYIF